MLKDIYSNMENTYTIMKDTHYVGHLLCGTPIMWDTYMWDTYMWDTYYVGHSLCRTPIM
jgi:hypothetical protein